MIFLAAWSCFLVRKVPLTGTKTSATWKPSHPDGAAAGLLLDFGVMVGGAPGGLFETLVLFVAAVVLLDEHGGSAALLEALLLVVGPEL